MQPSMKQTSPPRLIRTGNHVFPHFLNQFESCFLLLITKYILSESILFQLTISHTFVCVFIHEIFFTKVLRMVFAGSKTSTFHLTSVITFLIYRRGFVCLRCLVCHHMISSQSFQLCLRVVSCLERPFQSNIITSSHSCVMVIY